MSRNIYVDLHILQDLPPSNVNRDDNGTPKQAIYGGVQRLRASSQSWKRATRLHFASQQDPDGLGVRTRRLHGLLAELLQARGLDEGAAHSRADAAIRQIKITPDKKKKDADGAPLSSYLLFAGLPQLNLLADALAADDEGAEQVDVAGILGSIHPLDVALFGRMVADMAQLNVDAAAQVAHAISTHAAPTQFDYFTAVDDHQGDDTGAGMIGTVEFSSATMYRFATVGLEQLVENMGDRDKAIDGIGQFISSFSLSVPSGHQNSFAAHTRPTLVTVVVREDQPVNFVSAFESPVSAGAGGFMAASLSALASYFSQESDRWGDRPRLVVASYTAAGQAHAELEAAFGGTVSMRDLVSAVTRALREASTSE